MLSAFPTNIRLPDPFTPNLKIESLPEVSQSPRILADFVSIVVNINNGAFKQNLDNYLLNGKTTTNTDFLNVDTWLPIITTTTNNITTPDDALITSLIVYIGSYGANQLKPSNSTNTPSKVAIQSLSCYDLLKYLLTHIAPDAEFRYHILNSMLNQLRYPNIHTYFFNCFFLQLFLDLNTTNESNNKLELLLQEQITRVFLERLIVHRPHPVSISIHLWNGIVY